MPNYYLKIIFVRLSIKRVNNWFKILLFQMIVYIRIIWLWVFDGLRSLKRGKRKERGWRVPGWGKGERLCHGMPRNIINKTHLKIKHKSMVSYLLSLPQVFQHISHRSWLTSQHPGGVTWHPFKIIWENMHLLFYMILFKRNV